MICRTEKGATPLRTRRICLTEQQWRELSLNSGRQMQDFSEEQSRVSMGAIPSR